MTGEVEEFPTSRNSDPAHQFKYCNFRPGTEPDRKARGTDASLDIKLRARFFVPSACVMRHDEAEVEIAMHPVERQLTAVSVARHSPINANALFGYVTEHSRVMNQHKVACTP